MAAISSVLVTCEHGGNRIPRRWRSLFEGQEALLASHRGWDPGALTLARRLSRELDAPLVASTTSRLLVELNRSIGHPLLFSARTRDLPRDERERILEGHYHPYRNEVQGRLADALRSAGRGGAILHLSVHTFTPTLNGEVRNADIGLLYDPARKGEQHFAAAWRAALREVAPELRVRMNYPYRGAADGLTTHLRRRLRASRYLGIELEVNQALAAGHENRRKALLGQLSASIRKVLDHCSA
jgi:predicted N-formylglutamate amidohydrolase